MSLLELCYKIFTDAIEKGVLLLVLSEVMGNLNWGLEEEIIGLYHGEKLVYCIVKEWAPRTKIKFDNSLLHPQIPVISYQLSVISYKIIMATIFTKIIAGDIPSHKVAETDEHIAFLDINPIAEGHTLVVPKKEIDYFFDLPESLMRSTMDLSQAIARAIDEALNPIRTGIIVQGLEVPHAHLHLIPLYKTQQVMALGHKVEVSEERMKELASQISSKVKL